MVERVSQLNGLINQGRAANDQLQSTNQNLTNQVLVIAEENAQIKEMV